MNKEKEIVEKALQFAKEAGAQDARISFNKGIESSIVVLNDKIDKLQSASGAALSIQLYIDGRYGYYSTNMMEESALKEFITKAAQSTRLLEVDECRVLPDKELYYKGGGEDLQQYDSVIETLTTQEKIDVAMEVAGEVLGSDPRLISVETEFGDLSDYTYTADTQGFAADTLQSSFTISASCSIKGEDDSKPESWWYDMSMFYSKLQSKGCGVTALKRGIDSINPRQLPSGRYNIVIENTLSSKMVAPIISALNGTAIQQQNSFLLDTLGKEVFPQKLNLIDTPHLVGYSGSRYFDGEGIATKNMEIVKNGIITTYFINTYNSKKLGMPPTIEGPSVLRFSKEGEIGGKKLSLHDILKSVGNGILITRFNGGNYNSSTGDFSYGIQGFLFENGTIVHPVNEMNITGNLIRLWNNLIMTGDDPMKCTRWQIPTLAFSDVDVSGI